MEEDYSKREIDEKFTDIKESLNRIEVQTVKHNSRLTKVEKWMYTCIGGLTILSFLVGAKMLPTKEPVSASEIQKQLIDLQVATQKLQEPK